MRDNKLPTGALAAGLVASATAHAVDISELRFRLGQVTDMGEPTVGELSVSVEPGDPPAWLGFIGDDLHYEATLGFWNDAQADGGDIFKAHFTPAWRYAPGALAGRGFVEFGIGPTVLSDDELDDDDVGGQFHFTTHATLGFELGDQRRWRPALRVQHTSNAGIEDDNPGINAVLFELSYRFGND